MALHAARSAPTRSSACVTTPRGSAGVTEVLAYGTAVVIKPKS